jgi:hypothetical protein
MRQTQSKTQYAPAHIGVPWLHQQRGRPGEREQHGQQDGQCAAPGSISAM